MSSTDQDLERALGDLAARIDYPPTPDLAAAVRAHLEGRPRSVLSRNNIGKLLAAWDALTRRRPGEPGLRRPLPRGEADRAPRHGWQSFGLRFRPIALVAAAALVLLAASLAFWPSGWTAVAERLGLRGVEITHVSTLPTPAPAGLGLWLGELTTLDAAQAQVSHRILLPSGPELGPPDQVYLGAPPRGMVSFVYWPRPGLPPAAQSGVGLLLTQFPGDLGASQSGDPGVAPLGKGVGPGTRVESVSVSGGEGFWIQGEPHLFYYRDPSGAVRQENVRLAGNVLLWEQGELTLRLESALSKSEALRIAASVR